MNIGGFQKLTLLDYPGEVACIIFTAGCDFRCPFCHNASIVGDKTEYIEKAEVLAYLKKRSGVLDGVVITGGEPLIYPDTIDFLRELRGLGLKIKLDTNGSYPDRLEEILNAGLVDYVAMDIKHTKAKYHIAAGVAADLSKISHSIELLRSGGVKTEFRTTFVKGIHDISDAGKIAEELSCDSPYYIQSYIDSGDVISPSGLSAFSEAELSEMLTSARRFCPNAKLRGL